MKTKAGTTCCLLRAVMITSEEVCQDSGNEPSTITRAIISSESFYPHTRNGLTNILN